MARFTGNAPLHAKPATTVVFAIAMKPATAVVFVIAAKPATAVVFVIAAKPAATVVFAIIIAAQRCLVPLTVVRHQYHW